MYSNENNHKQTEYYLHRIFFNDDSGSSKTNIRFYIHCHPMLFNLPSY